MPATGIRCIMVIRDDVYSITEVHVNLSTDFGVVKPKFVELYKARMALCGPPALPYRGRMTLIGARRQTRKLTAFDINQVNTVPAYQVLNDRTGALGPNSSDQPKSCVLLRAVGDGGTEKSIFLAGVPDPVISELPAGPRVTLIPAYDALFQTYRTRLISDSWGYVGRETNPVNTKPTAITGYSINPDNNYTGVEVTGLAANWPKNTPVMVRNAKMSNSAYKSPEGQWVVDSAVDNLPAAGTVTIYLRNSNGVQIGQIVERGTIELVLFVTIPYADVYPESQTTRKRGNRSLVGPGRVTRRKKISL